ncbi:gluconokinase [Streptomyces sp. NBC_01216]|uniref:gluconokinase n=1 Tax=Streptomyces sp. NBC_01216 TaxID=2903778 RepID=UPI002E14442C|nr:gluconokinase [Streptomyces sp. NBC_01216]
MPAQARGPAVVVVVGVSGSGKSTVGGLLARRLRVPFLEGDDLHSAANRAKMAAGRPLDDADRGPWLDSLADWIREADASGRGGVVACSALKHAYRERLRAANPGVWFLYLRVEPAIAVRRVAHRAGHFMPARLVAPQYADLEPLRPDEPGLSVDATADPVSLADRAARAVTSPDGPVTRSEAGGSPGPGRPPSLGRGQRTNPDS